MGNEGRSRDIHEYIPIPPLLLFSQSFLCILHMMEEALKNEVRESVFHVGKNDENMISILIEMPTIYPDTLKTDRLHQAIY